MLYGMQQLASAGMNFATVANFGNNEAARGLYKACGFKPWHLLDGYAKHFELDQNRDSQRIEPDRPEDESIADS